MSYTNKDLDNGITYSNNRYTLRAINKLYTTIPHIISHMEYSIEQANPDVDYYYPSTFANRAIKVTTKIPSKMCSKISCNSIMAETNCTRDTIASYYIVGDGENFQRQCEPSCFHLTKNVVIDEETGNEQVQMLRLDYNDEFGCILMPTAYAWHEHPFYRSSEVYEHRLNDLPTGFNLGDRDPYSYSGMTYKYNKSYCDAYFDQWDEVQQTCVKKWWETVLYAVVGESIVKIVKSGIQSIENGYKSDYPPVDFPSIPDIESEWTVLGWTQDVNTSFILPPIEYENPTESGFIQREILDKNNEKLQHKALYFKNIELIKQIKNKQRQIGCTLRRKIEDNYDIQLNPDELAEITRIKTTNKKYKYKDITLINKHDGTKSDVISVISEIINGLLSSIFDPNFWVDIGIGILSDTILDQMKVVFRKLANDIIPKLTTTILNMTGKFMSKVFTKSIISTITNTMSKIVIKTISKVMVQLTKLAAEVASVVGIILAIITIFDILLTIWDPLGFNNKFDIEILKSVTRSSDIAMRQSLEMSVPVMSFELFTNMCLTSEEIIDESLHTFVYIYEYLNILTVNSEGTRLDKGVEIDFEDVGENGIGSDQAIADTKIITPKEIFDYELDHSHRMRFYKTSLTISTSLIIISSLFMVLDMWIFALIFFILTMIVISLSYINSSTLNIGKLVNDTLNFNF